MLRSISTNISIITNWGCNANCWYCIWKGHKLENISKPTDWEKLYKFLFKHKSKGKVSVSGGGDCLCKYEKYESWWNKLFNITKELNIDIDVHTREKFNNDNFWCKINRCVFSSDLIKPDIKYLRMLSEKTKIRITHLVTENTTCDLIKKYLELQKELKCQFTIKELIGFNDNNMYAKIRRKYPDIFYLDEGDYNIYYMPDNTITRSFL